MKVSFSQIYIEVGVGFSFSRNFQRRLSSEVTALAAPSQSFVKQFGNDYELVFRISAKKGIQNNEIRGPAVYRKAKEIEFAIFLPFSVISIEQDRLSSALSYLLDGVCAVFDKLEIDYSMLVKRKEAIIKDMLTNSTTTQGSDPSGAPISR